MRGTACLLAGVRVEGPLVTEPEMRAPRVDCFMFTNSAEWNGGMDMERWSGMVE